VAVTDVDLEGARALAGNIEGRAYELDVRSRGSVDGALASIEDELGPVDVLVNNAGVDEFGFFLATEEPSWRRMIEVNLLGVVTMTHAVLPGMHERRRGRIVNVASEAGRLGSPISAVYSATKAGVIGFTKAIARQAAFFEVTCNAVAPGPIETPLLDSTHDQLGDDTARVVLERMVEATAMRRMGHPDEVAAVIAFLSSDDSSYITGETIGVSGGIPSP